MVNTQLVLLREFTNDQAALAKAVEQATGSLGGPAMTSESEAIQSQLKRNLAGPDGAPVEGALRAAAVATAGQPVANGADAIQARLASVMLDMLRMDSAVAAQGSRLTISALRSLVEGQRTMPGRKSILFFGAGMYLAPELDAPFSNLIGAANRNNVTFYTVDCRGVMVSAQTSGAREQLAGAAAASATAVRRTSGAVTVEEIMASDSAERSGRANVQEAIRHLAESTGGFLIGDSNDLRTPLRRVTEEIASYYEVSFNPEIQNFDGAFRKLSVIPNRKDLVIHGRSGYFALPPGVRGNGVQPYEAPLLQLLSSGQTPNDVRFRAGTFLLEPGEQASSALVLIEIPLQGLQTTVGRAPNMREAHCSLVALVKDERGEVVEKLAHDRTFQMTPEQWKGGNFLDRMTISVPAGKYTLETAVKDEKSGKFGVVRSAFTAAAPPKGVGASSLAVMRSFTPNTRPDASDPFRFEGGTITPTLDAAIRRGPNAMLRLFFTVYADRAAAAKPTVEVEILQSGASLTKSPLQLPDPDAQGRIPYLMTIPAASIPPGEYEVRVVARQAGTSAVVATTVRIEQ
jgi:VWFA-related protein